eukprot:CAMPEP_0173467382 /NCGR_PEP_ID=MMETSP1357-20121228/74967_1 /TAXON_ID=77926 /ORGANISM="Hemiselmis rufescens, Strain PCC563" /LENGTH=54 /DNA_ID=CAMNT_0014435515 /DNA_START=29 /DNA_END=190 /DNA_ORIENTATION=-
MEETSTDPDLSRIMFMFMPELDDWEPPDGVVTAAGPPAGVEWTPAGWTPAEPEE